MQVAALFQAVEIARLLWPDFIDVNLLRSAFFIFVHLLATLNVREKPNKGNTTKTTSHLDFEIEYDLVFQRF